MHLHAMIHNKAIYLGIYGLYFVKAKNNFEKY